MAKKLEVYYVASHTEHPTFDNYNGTQDNWRESQKKVDVYERSRRRSFKIAQELTAKSPDIHERILDDMPAEKKEEIIRKISVARKPARYEV